MVLSTSTNHPRRKQKRTNYPFLLHTKQNNKLSLISYVCIHPTKTTTFTKTSLGKTTTFIFYYPPLTYNLKQLKQHIDLNNSYNIYISDENFIIKNTTFSNDLGFNLSFAKEIFYKHKQQHIIGVSTPIYEKSTQQFFSYSDSFIPLGDNKEGILQVSYTYKHFNQPFLNIKKELYKHKEILDAKAYILTNDGFITSIPFFQTKKYKPSIIELLNDKQTTQKIKQKLKQSQIDTIYIETIPKTYTKYLYIVSQSPIFKSTKIYFSILIDQTKLYNQLHHLQLVFFFLIFLGVVAILSLWHFLLKEKMIHFQDAFLSSTMHEIKTPLSIISLNNELLELKQGKNKHTQAIDNAIKLLHTTYEDLHFTMNKQSYNHPKTTINLCKAVEQRVAYFSPIAQAEEKQILFEATSSCDVFISTIELERLIDNNISNAIKYTKENTPIKIHCNKNTLCFETTSKDILNKKRIFQRYYRENTQKGGHGLGLWIVQEIASRNNITIKLTSSNNKTIFCYYFVCKESS